VRASTGDNRLGGEDFNELLVQMMKRRFEKDWVGAREDPALIARLAVAAEQARRTLTDKAEAVMSVIWKDTPYHFTVTTDAFEAEVEPLLKRLREPVLRALRDSGIHGESLKQIVLVGGATRMPVVYRAVARMFGRFPARTVNPDEAVALGAAVQAGLKSRDAALKEVVLTDVCPYTLGVDVSERLPNGQHRTGIFSPIIERNTVVPTSREQSFVTMQDNQQKVVFGVYQGESRLVADNILLGKQEIPVPRGRAGEIEVFCRFSYDINGLLEVDLHVPKTGEKRQLVIIDDDEITPAELDGRRAALALLKQHPREADANRAALARASRCFENQLGDVRHWVGRLIGAFEAALEGQDPRAIDTARADLLRELDKIEGETWL
jgi:molecular chaperone HscC